MRVPGILKEFATSFRSPFYCYSDPLNPFKTPSDWPQIGPGLAPEFRERGRKSIYYGFSEKIFSIRAISKNVGTTLIMKTTKGLIKKISALLPKMDD